MTVDLEAVFLGQGCGQVADRAGTERDNRPTARADQVMAVDRSASDVYRPSSLVQDAAEDAEGCQDLQGPVHGGSARFTRATRRLSDKLLGGEGLFLAQCGGDHSATRRGDPVTLAAQCGNGLCR